jgi:hypothetical protein
MSGFRQLSKLILYNLVNWMNLEMKIIINFGH